MPPPLPLVKCASLPLSWPVSSVSSFSLEMASPISTITSTSENEIAMEIPTIVRVHKNGTIQRLQNSPFVPPSLHGPTTQVSSKDILISHNPSVSARLYLPFPNPTQKLPVLVYFHGGGFFFESAFNHLHHTYFHSFLSQSNALVFSVEYRLAPEHPLPAAYEDCWLALQWVASHFTTNLTIPSIEPWLINHGDSLRIYMGGDSAGGNIVHNMAMRAGREALPGGVKILGAYLSHPFFHGSKPIGREPVEPLEQSAAFLLWKLVYPSAPGGVDNFMINPLADGAPSLSELGCGKMLVCVAGKDGLRDRGVWYYEGVKKSGWKGELELFEAQEEDHTFHIHNPHSENAKIMIKRLADFIR